MNKIFILSVGLLCILIAAQAASTPKKPLANTTQDDDSDDDAATDAESEMEENDDSEAEEEEEFEIPAVDLNCVLFGNAGCDATCAGISYFYGSASRGKCAEDQSCACTEQKTDSTLPFLWKEKFEEDAASKKLLQKITKDPELSEVALEILQRSPRTPSNTLDELISEISDLPELKDLQAKKVQVPVLQYVDKTDKVNRKKLQDFVSTMLKKVLQKDLFSIKNINYNTNLKKFLDEISDDDETLEYLQDEILKTDNAILKKHLGSDLAKTPFDFNIYAEDAPSFELVPEYVAATVADEFVKFINQKKATLAKSPSRKPAAKSNSPATTTKKPALSKPSKKNYEEGSDTVTVTNKYETPETDDYTSIESPSGAYKKTWRFENGEVSVDKAASGAIEVRWKIGNTAVILIKYASGAVDQTWHFTGNVTIRLLKHASGAVDQSWSIGNKQYEYHRYASGVVDTTNDIPSAYSTKYGQEMEEWCAANGKFFIQWDCVLYNKR